MIQYYGYTISPNQIETGEGFLICRNVPISRTGDQEYMGWEIGIPGGGRRTDRNGPPASGGSVFHGGPGKLRGKAGDQ